MSNILIKIDLTDNLAGFSFEVDGKEKQWQDFTYSEQVQICNSFVQGYNFWTRFLKEDA